jgi:resuscitation-promoting factor RpfA
MPEHDPELSQAYQRAAQAEPPPALDARILDAARRAVTPQPRRRPAWFGWAVPLSSMAVLVLGISMLLRMQQEAPEALREVQSPLPARPPQLTQVPSPQRETPVQPPAAGPGKPAAQSTGAAPRSAPAAVPLPASPEREAVGVDAEMEMAAESADVAAPPSPAMPRPSPAPEVAQENRAEARSSVPAFSAGISRLKSAAPAAAKAPPPEETPEQWVDSIRQLLRQGNIDAARTRLEAMRKRFPDFPLPPDLEPARCCPRGVPTPAP